MLTISVVMNLLGVRPYLTAHGLDLKALLIFCLLWGMGGAFISLLLSKKIAKWMLGVQLIGKDATDPTLQDIYSLVEGLSQKAGLSATPEVGVFQSPDPNAFATGPSEKRSLVAVSTGLLHQMSRDEIEAILGHEISHIKNGDMVTMTLIQGVVNAFVMFLARIIAYVISGVSRDRRGSYLSYYLFTFLFEFVFMILGSMIVARFSRFREFRADKGGANLAGTEKMISALESLQKTYDIQDTRALKPAMAALMIRSRRRKGPLSLFSTHPPLEKRIARLRESL